MFTRAEERQPSCCTQSTNNWILTVGQRQDPCPEWDYVNNDFIGCVLPAHFATSGYFLPKFKTPPPRILCQNKHPHSGIVLHFCHHSVALWGCRLPEVMASCAALSSLETRPGQQSPGYETEITWGSGDSLFWLPMCASACSLLSLSLLLHYATACYSHTIKMQQKVSAMTFQGQKYCFCTLSCCL